MSAKNQTRYQNGKIYKLVSDHTDKIYIGSTCLTLPKRLYGHRSDYTRYKSGKQRYMTSYEMLKLGDVEIILVENYACKDKNELHARERYWIDHFKDICVNKVLPTRSHREYYQTNSRELNRRHRIYAEQHKGDIKKNKAKYYKDNKEAINQKKGIKYQCACGSSYSARHKSRHFKTAMHQEYEQVKSNLEMYQNIRRMISQGQEKVQHILALLHAIHH